MSRSYRKINHRNWTEQSTHKLYTVAGVESCCKPGCGVCGKSYKRDDRRKEKRSKTLDIREGLE